MICSSPDKPPVCPNRVLQKLRQNPLLQVGSSSVHLQATKALAGASHCTQHSQHMIHIPKIHPLDDVSSHGDHSQG